MSNTTPLRLVHIYRDQATCDECNAINRGIPHQCVTDNDEFPDLVEVISCEDECGHFVVAEDGRWWTQSEFLLQTDLHTIWVNTEELDA